MPSAHGSIQSTQPDKFTATFDIDGSFYVFSGNINPPTQTFESQAAILEYNSIESLEGSQQFTGTIGSRDEASFTFNDGTVIKAPLDIPVNPASHVGGTGTWAQG
ncbi:hypothetical protein FPANT_8030 [Fusarium pseudoanthophilum]|uniref:Uncharacterized protein n=1 Tax=Fusarium pseudoanthophilum TaxID=48495 RepID=A0A8H5L090_9HYPO|nr:hypothetical protein FPANT_8030 [Fusarium pseudoanthophilum]